MKKNIACGCVSHTKPNFTTLRADIIIQDQWKPERKHTPVIVLKDWSSWEIGYLAEQCMLALREIEKRVQDDIRGVLDK